MRESNPLHRIVLALDGTDAIAPVSAQACLRTNGSSIGLDIYRPLGDRARPAVVFVHGDAPPEVLKGITQQGQYVSWGQTVAVSGFVGVNFEHSSSEGMTQIKRVLDEIEEVLQCVRTNADALGIDPNRLCLWSCSAGVPYAVSAALRSPMGIRCLVAYYGWLDLRPLAWLVDGEVSDATLASASPLAYLERGLAIPPMLLVKAGLDRPEVNASIDRFARAAGRSNAPVELIVQPTGRHAFDVLDDMDESRSVIEATISFMKRNT